MAMIGLTDVRTIEDCPVAAQRSGQAHKDQCGERRSILLSAARRQPLAAPPEFFIKKIQ
jgi:hypothetical protein